MTAAAEIDLAQDLATDCSVVASLCAAVRHFRPTEGSVRVQHILCGCSIGTNWLWR